jgi:1-carboxybiuret hydrolase subunit AtzG-like protein
MPKSSHPLGAYIDAAAAALAIPIEPEWKSEIRANLEVTFRFAALLAEKELPDDAEPAPVYQA